MPKKIDGTLQVEYLTLHDSLDGRLCLACGGPFEAGQKIQLVPLGPGSDERERERCASGKYYNAVSVPVHLPCATGKDA